MAAPKKTKELNPRLRIVYGENIALGPGKVELLQHIHQTGSLALAARKMGLSYMRAWTLIRTMNACFKKPVVTTSRGGKKGGGAQLTPTGLEALGIYRVMDEAAARAAEKSWGKMLKLLAS